MKIIAVVALWAAGLVHAADAKYTMKDLQALAKSEGWEELMAHSLDVPPSERNAEWQGLVEKSAVARLTALKGDELKYLSSTKGMIENDQKVFPFLKKSRDYKTAAGRAMIKTYKGCYQSRECKNGSDIDWIIDVRKFVEKDLEKDPDLACEAGDMVGSFMTGTVTLGFYEMATEKKKDCCGSDTFKKALKSSLKDDEYKTQAQALAAKCK